jgi:hypothetical protein
MTATTPQVDMCRLILLVHRFSGSSDTTDMELAATSVRNAVLGGAGQVPIRGWDAYRMAEHSARAGFYSLAGDIFDSLSNRVRAGVRFIARLAMLCLGDFWLFVCCICNVFVWAAFNPHSGYGTTAQHHVLKRSATRPKNAGQPREHALLA